MICTHTHIYIGKCLLVDYSLCLSKRIYTLTGGFISFIWILALNFWSAFTCAFLRIPFPSLFTKPMANSTNTFTCVGVKRPVAPTLYLLLRWLTLATAVSNIKLLGICAILSCLGTTTLALSWFLQNYLFWYRSHL